jgi:bleomycin hydrolase
MKNKAIIQEGILTSFLAKIGRFTIKIHSIGKRSSGLGDRGIQSNSGTARMTIRFPKVQKILLLALLADAFLHGQSATRDSAFYAEKNVYGRKKTVLTADFSKIRKPSSIEACKPVFHFPPVRQDTTNTCWSFSGISFLESEIFRMHGRKVKLSEMYTVYWEYVEKARRYVREKGNSEFPEGSEHEAVILRIGQYGTVPEEAYTGLPAGQTRHNHRKMVKEMNDYLRYVRENAVWEEEQVTSNIRMILDRHLGKPPESVSADGKTMTPKAYAEQALGLPLDAYVQVMSSGSIPFYTKGEFKVEDNWWHSAEYFNVPLDAWYDAIRRAIRRGYSVAIGGDVSEPGKSPENDLFIIPGFDVPDDRIDQSSREFRIYNKTTQDDHGIHLVGWAGAGGRDWFLIKDSGASAYDGKFKGYYFFRDDAVKLKMMTFMAHRDAVADLLDRCRRAAPSAEKEAKTEDAEP